MNMNKSQYVAALSIELEFLGVAVDERNEILAEFGQHFEDGAAGGLSEEQICEKLGDVREIALQYAPNAVGELGGGESGGVGTGSSESGGTFNPGGLVGIITLDIFVFSWAIPALFSLVISYYSVVLSLLVAGVTMMIPPTLLGSVVSSNFHPLSTVFLGVAFAALGGLGIILGIHIGRGFVAVIKAVINLHGEWVMGRKVFPAPSRGSRDNRDKEEVSA
jgi:uncharacterized membrane protein